MPEERKVVKSMCYTCGCTPCKCGAKIIGGVCEGCGMEYNDCDCEPKEDAG
jgi:hypothetical protein